MLPEVCGFLRYYKPMCSLVMSTTRSYSVPDVSYIAMFNNFDVTCVSDNFRLASSASYGNLNHHDAGGNMEARLAKYLKPQYPLPISTVSCDGVVDVSHVPVISKTDGVCENLSLISAAIVQV